MFAPVLVFALVGCGEPLPPEQYLTDFTDAYCAVWVECADPAALAFDGRSVDDCLAEHGPRFAAQWQGCLVDDDNASACLAFLEGSATCPTTGDVDDVLPLECLEAWEKCSGGATSAQ
jgi:hypothetical protein